VRRRWSDFIDAPESDKRAKRRYAIAESEPIGEVDAFPFDLTLPDPADVRPQPTMQETINSLR
jgi:hypothetical protein